MDLAQEVFVRALREEPERPRAWLFTVASNLAKDEIRTVILDSDLGMWIDDLHFATGASGSVAL